MLRNAKEFGIAIFVVDSSQGKLLLEAEFGEANCFKMNYVYVHVHVRYSNRLHDKASSLQL